MNCSLSFAMQRDYFQTKRSFTATKRAGEFAPSKSLRTLLALGKERECAHKLRVAPRQQCSEWVSPAPRASAAKRVPATDCRA
jgi:hypothetical protein